MKVKKTDLPVMPPEDILPSLDDEADESDMDDGKLKLIYFDNILSSDDINEKFKIHIRHR